MDEELKNIAGIRRFGDRVVTPAFKFRQFGPRARGKLLCTAHRLSRAVCGAAQLIHAARSGNNPLESTNVYSTPTPRHPVYGQSRSDLVPPPRRGPPCTAKQSLVLTQEVNGWRRNSEQTAMITSLRLRASVGAAPEALAVSILRPTAQSAAAPLRTHCAATERRGCYIANWATATGCLLCCPRIWDLAEKHPSKCDLESRT